MTPIETGERLRPCADCGRSCSVDAPSCPNCGKPLPSDQAAPGGKLRDAIYNQILAQSTTRVGMCLTLLGLIRVVEGVKDVHTWVDEMLAINAVGFLVSSMFSHFALKDEESPRKHRKGRAADVLFSGSLCLLIGICITVALQLL